MPTRVIYVHGMGGQPADWLAVQARQPGFALPLPVFSENPQECAEDLANAVLEVGAPSFALCGYSMGGRISLLAAKELLQQKKKPYALVLVSSGFGSSDPIERQQRVEKDQEWATLLEANPQEFWEKWYAQELFSSLASVPETTRIQWLENRKSIDIKEIAAQLRDLSPGQHEDLLPIVRELSAAGVRVLYLAGKRDKKYSEIAEKLGAMGLPGVSVSIIPEAGHVLPLEAPDALALRIQHFVK